MGLRSERIVSRRDVAVHIAVEPSLLANAPVLPGAGACIQWRRGAVRPGGIMCPVAGARRRRDSASSAIGGSVIRPGDPR